MSAKTWRFTLNAEFAQKHAPKTWDLLEYPVTYIWCGVGDSGALHGVVQFEHPMKLYQAKLVCPYANWVGKTGEVTDVLQGIKHLRQCYEEGVFTAGESVHDRVDLEL